MITIQTLTSCTSYTAFVYDVSVVFPIPISFLKFDRVSYTGLNGLIPGL